MRDEVGSPWDFGPIRPLTYRGDGASQITKGRGVNGAPTPFRSHGAHRKRGGMRLSLKPTIVAGESHKVFALWLSIRLLRNWRLGART